jgi:outer membrane protein TolC
MKKAAREGWMPGLLILVMLTGCTASHYRRSADLEAYGVIREKTPRVRNMDPSFTIEQTNIFSLSSLPVSTNVPEYLGPEGERELDASVLRLEDALDIAIHHSRSFQNRKEDLFSSALTLTLARHRFTPLFSASVDGGYTADLTDHLAETHQVSGGGRVGVDWLIRDLGRITAAFTADFSRFLSGGPGTLVSSQLGMTFTRPLLRNSGFKQEQEALTQAERQLLYELRDFTQFRKDFTVQIARSFYDVLGSRDTVRNNYFRLQASRKNAERARAMVAEGRNTTAELGRLEQQELSAESAWVGAVRNYRQALDNFKFQLGLSVEANLVLDERELDSLRIHHPDIGVEDSIRVALAGRLDYLNTRDKYQDAERRVKLTANLLHPRLDLTAGATFVSNPNAASGVNLPEWDRYRWNAGLILDPGLDRKAERNDYRNALIARDRAGRSLEQQEDQIKLQVRESWRTLDQAKRSYEISEHAVKIAERRVEEQSLFAELGRAKAQDQVDAQNDLISSRNERTLALVTHTIARLQFWNNLGILYIKDNGQWEEIEDEKTR